MTIDAETAVDDQEVDGKTYYFCSRHCSDRFRSDPNSYLADNQGERQESCCGGAQPVVRLAVAGTHHQGVEKSCCGGKPSSAASSAGGIRLASRYVCPMHPEVVSDRPGNCPKCGMALEADRSTVSNSKLI
jgi:Cu+-exporting ATPase